MLTSETAAVIATNVILAVLAISAVALRIFIRKHKIKVLQADDFLILGALFFAVALAITNVVGAAIGGFGKPFTSLSEETVVIFLKVLYVLQFWYIVAVGFVKLSVLYFYGRLFSVRRFPMIIHIFMAITVAWMISFLFATLFQVWPISCNWIFCPKPSTNYPVMYVCCSVTDIVLDIAILCLPASFLKTLQITPVQRAGITSIFGLGVFCTVASIARLVYTTQLVIANVNQDFASNFGTSVVNMIMWSGIEACASVICACLPCYAPLITASPRFRSMISSMRSRSSRRPGSYARSKSPGKMLHRATSSMEQINPVRSPVQTTIKGGGGRYVSEKELEMGQIGVDREVFSETTRDANGFGDGGGRFR